MGDRVGAIQSEFLPRTTIKGQALADFIVEFSHYNAAEVTRTTNRAEAAKVAGVREEENFVPTKRDAK